MEREITTVYITKMPVLFVRVSNTTIVCCSVNGSVNLWSGRTVAYRFCREGKAKCVQMCPSAAEIGPLSAS